jgi:hypothetical protein
MVNGLLLSESPRVRETEKVHFPTPIYGVGSAWFMSGRESGSNYSRDVFLNHRRLQTRCHKLVWEEREVTKRRWGCVMLGSAFYYCLCKIIAGWLCMQCISAFPLSFALRHICPARVRILQRESLREKVNKHWCQRE